MEIIIVSLDGHIWLEILLARLFVAVHVLHIAIGISYIDFIAGIIKSDSYSSSSAFIDFYGTGIVLKQIFFEALILILALVLQRDNIL